MKSNYTIRESDTVKGLIWHSWVEHCDCCGVLIHDLDFKTTKAPDLNEKDYCIDCLRDKLFGGKNHE